MTPTVDATLSPNDRVILQHASAEQEIKPVASILTGLLLQWDLVTFQPDGSEVSGTQNRLHSPQARHIDFLEPHTWRPQGFVAVHEGGNSALRHHI